MSSSWSFFGVECCLMASNLELGVGAVSCAFELDLELEDQVVLFRAS